jgi:hypothetical protein
MVTHETVAGHHAAPRPATSNGNFVRHYFEMLAAMIVGMVVFGGIASAVFAVLGHSSLLHYAALRSSLMAGYMTSGMALWMRYRGHGWQRVGEMGAAMFLPFFLLVGPFWTGLVSSAALLGGTHVLMLPAMLGVMLLNREEYSRAHGSHHDRVVPRAT